MQLHDITPLLITFNEAPNLPRTLAALNWARRIVVVDSGSTDDTLTQLSADSRVQIFTRRFDNFAAQCSHGLAAVETTWVLSLDADHVMPPDTTAMLQALDETHHDAFRAPFCYCINGKPLRSSLLPPRIILFRKDRGRYENDGHAHRIVVTDRVGALSMAVRHDDRKPLERWLLSQLQYSRLEALKIEESSWHNLTWPDRFRRCFLGPLVILPFCLFLKGLILDGKEGWYYSLQRLYAEVLLALRLAEFRFLRP